MPILPRVITAVTFPGAACWLHRRMISHRLPSSVSPSPPRIRHPCRPGKLQSLSRPMTLQKVPPQFQVPTHASTPQSPNPKPPNTPIRGDILNTKPCEAHLATHLATSLNCYPASFFWVSLLPAPSISLGNKHAKSSREQASESAPSSNHVDGKHQLCSQRRRCRGG